MKPDYWKGSLFYGSTINGKAEGPYTEQHYGQANRYGTNILVDVFSKESGNAQNGYKEGVALMESYSSNNPEVDSYETISVNGKAVSFDGRPSDSFYWDAVCFTHTGDEKLEDPIMRIWRLQKYLEPAFPKAQESE